MNKSGRPKGRSTKTVENKKRQLTKQYNKLQKLQSKITLQEYLKQIKESNKNK